MQSVIRALAVHVMHSRLLMQLNQPMQLKLVNYTRPQNSKLSTVTPSAMDVMAAGKCMPVGILLKKDLFYVQNILTLV